MAMGTIFSFFYLSHLSHSNERLKRLKRSASLFPMIEALIIVFFIHLVIKNFQEIWCDHFFVENVIYLMSGFGLIFEFPFVGCDNFIISKYL